MYAAKRQRPASGGVSGANLSHDDARAAKMIGELVPLLASVGPLDDKLRLVSQRLSAGTGYHAVNFDVFEEHSEEVNDRNTTMGTNAYIEAPDQLVEQWRQEQRTHVNHPLGDILRRTQRPVIMDDLAHDERLTQQQRDLLKAVGVQSGIAVPLLWQDEWIGTMSVGSRELAAFGPRDAQFLMAVAAHTAAIIRTARMVEQLRLATDRLASSHNDTVLMLAASVEAHDSTTGQHLQRVCTVTELLALELGYGEEDAHTLGMASVLHDIGKVRVPDSILKSQDRLTEEQWLIMKQHTVWGADFLAGHAGYELASLIARAHHERWDGSGYPYSLAGEDIPEAAAIVTVADAFDAMISDRPYRRARTLASAVREVWSNSGRQFNPRVVAALLRVYRARKLPAGDAATRADLYDGFAPMLVAEAA
jgi:response regulator RpfG family c-di-GMP phosphodiesterase